MARRARTPPTRACTCTTTTTPSGRRSSAWPPSTASASRCWRRWSTTACSSTCSTSSATPCSSAAESYGLKRVELLTGFERSHEIDAGAGAVVEYDAWTARRRPVALERIARYNEDDVRATLAVRDWLVRRPAGRRPDWRDTPTLEPEDEQRRRRRRRDADRDRRAVEGPARPPARVLGREGRAHRPSTSPCSRADARPPTRRPRVVAGLHVRAVRSSRSGRQRGRRAVFSFPPQELAPELIDGAASSVMFPAGPDGIVSVGNDGVDVAHGELTVVWGEQRGRGRRRPVGRWSSTTGSTREPKPTPLDEIATADRRRSTSLVPGDRSAARTRAAPLHRLADGPPTGRFTSDMDEIVEAAAALDRSVLAVQGPPGTGKTYTGAHDHPAPRRRRQARRRHGVQPPRDRQPAPRVPRPRTRRCASCARAVKPRARRDAGSPRTTRTGRSGTPATTTSSPARAGCSPTRTCGHRRPSTSSSSTRPASSGSPTPSRRWRARAQRDPARRPAPARPGQRSPRTPAASGASALEHVLGDDATMPPDRGVFLDVTRRMHPDVCAFISTQIYDGRLQSHIPTALASPSAARPACVGSAPTTPDAPRRRPRKRRSSPTRSAS